LLDAVAKAAGGRENVAAWKGLMFRGKVLPLVDGPSSTLRVDLDLAGSLREEMRDARGERTHWLSGPMAWSGGERPKAAPPELAADLRARFHELAATFELVLADADSLEDLGLTPEKWTRLAHRVGGIRLGYDVDVTGRLHRVVRLDGQGRDGSTQMEIEELREVRGVRLPFRWTSVVDGHALSETILERVERVDDRDLSEFLPPGVAGGL